MGETTHIPRIAVTMGDPAGNGPELSVKALSHAGLYERMHPIVVGDTRILELAAPLVGQAHAEIRRISRVEEAEFSPGIINVFHKDLVDLDNFAFGKLSANCGLAAFESVVTAIQLALDNQVDATCTNALNKEAMNLGLKPQGKHFDGHTEIYAHYTKTKNYTMMLAHHDLRVVHVSTHVSLREACNLVKKDRVLDVIRLAHHACQELGIKEPRIAVAGLNPHAGEGGLFGREEIDEIIPALEAARHEGLAVEGPIPPDTLFPKALGGWYDICVCMYHDQGHIPLKTVGFVYDRVKQAWKAVEGVNITLGLPIIRTSVDHGTGFDLAGTGKSSELSLLNALDYAAELARHHTTL